MHSTKHHFPENICEPKAQMFPDTVLSPSQFVKTVGAERLAALPYLLDHGRKVIQEAVRFLRRKIKSFLGSKCRGGQGSHTGCLRASSPAAQPLPGRGGTPRRSPPAGRQGTKLVSGSRSARSCASLKRPANLAGPRDEAAGAEPRGLKGGERGDDGR